MNGSKHKGCGACSIPTMSMMSLVETGFHEWNEEGEDIYDGEAEAWGGMACTVTFQRSH